MITNWVINFSANLLEDATNLHDGCSRFFTHLVSHIKRKNLLKQNMVMMTLMPPNLNFTICFLKPLTNLVGSLKLAMVSNKPDMSSLGITHGTKWHYTFFSPYWMGFQL